MMDVFFNIIISGYLIVGILMFVCFFNPIMEDDHAEDGFNLLETAAIIILAWLPIYLSIIRITIKEKSRDKKEVSE